MTGDVIKGPRFELSQRDEGYPAAFQVLADAPKRLYVIGDPGALVPGLAVIGARKATPYGLGSARRFASIAAEKGVTIVSGGARGCDSEAHRAALEAGGPTVAFLGGGCDCVYPPEHLGLFQQVVDAGGAVVSENPWGFKPKPYTFRMRNRLIAGLSEAVLIVEAGLPSGTFSTADEALSIGKEVLVVPGAITSPSSHGSNRLLYQGAVPVIDDETFEDALFAALGALKRPRPGLSAERADATGFGLLVEAARAEPMPVEALYRLSVEAYGEAHARERMMGELIEAEAAGAIARYPDGRWGPCAKG